MTDGVSCRLPWILTYLNSLKRAEFRNSAFRNNKSNFALFILPAGNGRRPSLSLYRQGEGCRLFVYKPLNYVLKNSAPDLTSRAVSQTIPEFFSEKCVFLTGGTGFMGKVLVEKILRSCPKVDTIFLLMRPRKGASPEERLKNILDLPLFDRVKTEQPNVENKLRIVYGDVTELNLGLSDEDRQIITEKVNILVHAAASVRFDDRLSDAILMNTRGTREVANLALECQNVQVFCHISTTYCNTHRKVIGEQLYPIDVAWRDAIKIAEELDKNVVDVMQTKYLGTYPNTYTFTKALAEQVVNDLCKGKVPTVIFRPSIVISTFKEPMAGWLDNFNGPVGLLVASGKGLTKIVYANPNIVADYMPADLAIKGLMIALWEKATCKNLSKRAEISFYNCSSYQQQNLTMREMCHLGRSLAWDIPMENQLWHPCGGITNNATVFYVLVILLHVLPALFFDLLLKLSGRKPLLLKIQRRIFIANSALAYFINDDWSFLNEKILELEGRLLPEDKADFGYEKDEVDVYEYFRNCCIAGKRYLLKEDMSEEGLKKAKIRSRRMWILHCTTVILFNFLVAWVVLSKIYSYVPHYF